LTVIDLVDGPVGVLAGTANVIMQLSRAPVGHAVLESTVTGSQVTRHPLKRFRTTFTYLSVALLGDDDERRAYREAVDRAHRRVRSGPDSPVGYNAFDPELQLWVAACLYYGAADVLARMRGPLDDDVADSLYAAAAPLATTLQVPPERWPVDRAAFEEYWDSALRQVSIDPPVRRYLLDLASLRFLPPPLRLVQGPVNLFITTGFLPPPFREAMGMEWAPSDQKRFDRLMAGLAFVGRRSPAPVRAFPLNWFLWDFRLRRHLGMPLA
jgi:uncharacterized protein (DUF2236 family)